MASTSRDNEGTFIQGRRNEFMSTFYSFIPIWWILSCTRTLWRHINREEMSGPRSCPLLQLLVRINWTILFAVNPHSSENGTNRGKSFINKISNFLLQRLKICICTWSLLYSGWNKLLHLFCQAKLSWRRFIVFIFSTSLFSRTALV